MIISFLSMKSDGMMELFPFKVSHLRMKCALLAMKAVQRAILKREAAMKVEPPHLPKQKNKK